MHVKTLAPLPPTHNSAGKPKGGGGGGLLPASKPYLTLSVEKAAPIGSMTLHKSNSKRKLAALGTNMMNQSSPPNQDLGSVTPPNNMYF
jgi:hypothetical protein